jgi:AcrR family transcriptional regulator
MSQRKNAELRKQEILEHFYQVIIEQGIEGASIKKIAKSMDINPSLISHYFKTKGAMLIELTEYIKEKYDPSFIRLEVDSTTEPQQRYNRFFEIMFSEVNVETVDNRVFYAFYYLSYRNPEIKKRFSSMFKKHRDFINQELEFFKSAGLIEVELDLTLASNFIISVIEGLSFQNAFLSNGILFEIYEKFAVKVVKDFLER